MIKSLIVFVLFWGAPKDDSIELIYPDSVLTRAAAFRAEGEHQKAVELYHKVSPNDTSYLQIQAELMSTYNALDEYDKTISIGTTLKDTNSKFRKDIYINLGNAYVDSGFPEKGLEIYAEALNLFPFNYLLLYNLGYACYKLDKYPEALSYFQQSAKINPYYANNHLMMGYLSVLQGHKTKAMLSYMTYLAINPARNATLIYLDNLASDAIREEASIPSFSDNSRFAYYDDLIRSKAALDDRFKLEVEFNANIVKQSELLFSKLSYVENTDDFWMDYYVPLYKKLISEELHPAFIYFILQSSKKENILQWIEKNDKQKAAWIEYANSSLAQTRSVNHAEILEEKGRYNFWYYGSNALSAIGNQIDDETRIGPWIFFYENNYINAQGRYNDQGQKTGEWLFYHENGRLSRKEHYNDEGIIDKSAIYYHDNGALSIVANYSEGQLDGPLEYYFGCGKIKEEVPFLAGVKNGPGKFYHETGELKIDYNFSNDELDGDYSYYFKNGQIEKKYFYESGSVTGKYHSFYMDGQKNEIGEFANDLACGAWTGYHPDGELSYQGAMENDQRTGLWEFYHTNGKIKEIIHYNENGEKNGENKNFNENGTLNSVIEYNHDKIIGLAYLDYLGNTLFEAHNEMGNMEYQNYYPSGELFAEGAFKNGKLNCPYLSYYKNGIVRQKGTMVDDNFHGEYEEYYPTGQLYIRCNYENGIKEGFYQQFYKNGTVSHEGYYVNDLQEQLWRSYFPDGALDEEVYYISGKINGQLTSYAPGGKPHMTFKYDMDVMTGLKQYDSLGGVYHESEIPLGNGILSQLSVAGDTIYKTHLQGGLTVSDVLNLYPGGQIMSYNPMVNGLNQGEYMAYLPDGSLRVKGGYLNDVQDGIWKWFYPNGQISSEQFYVRGSVEKELKSYHPNGQLESVCSYSEDSRHGACHYYDQSGNLQITKINDKQDGFIAYIDVLTNDTIDFVDEGEFTINSKFKNGKTAVTQNYLNGKLHGETIFYNQTGYEVERIEYMNGDNHGTWTIYHPNGNIYRETIYRDDLKYGIEREYFENGNIRRETRYINDNICGDAIIYTRDGKIQSKLHYWNGTIYK